MSYRARIGSALLLALLLHLPLLAALPALLKTPVPEKEPEPRALMMAFQPPPTVQPEPVFEPEAPKQLVESGAEADAPSPDSDLISDRNTKAQDSSESVSEDDSPAVDRVDEFDQLATSPNALPSSPTPPTPEIPPMEEVIETAPEAPEPVESSPAPAPPTVEEPSAEEAPNPEAPRTLVAAAEPSPEPEPTAEEPPPEPSPPQEEPQPEQPEQPEVEPVPERFQVAEAPPAQKFVEELNTSVGRNEGGASSKGIQSFEANRHEMGAYMIHVRRKVEKTWRRNLRIDYVGTSKTYSVLECSIRPNGEIEYVKIIEPGPSMNYAALCREALLDSGPFDPFPFDVPSIYREQNLVITWRLSFL